MSNSREEADETSPLLPRSDGLRQLPPDPVDSTEELVGEDSDTNRHLGDDNDHIEDAEGQIVSNGRPGKYDGMPEVRKKLRIIFPAIAIGVFLAAADQTIIVTSYGKIGSELHALNKTSWIATAYFLTLTSFQPLYGKLSDIFGRKPCILFAYTLFGLGCLFCGMSRTIDQLVMSRAFAGIGGGGMTTVVSILLSDVMTLRERGTWQGYINIVYAAGAATGAPLGGILADFVGWRYAFLGQVPLCLIAFIAVAFALHLPKPDQSHWKDKLKRIDFLGAVVLLGAVGTLLLGLDRGSNVAWKDTYTIIFMSVSLPLFVIFIAIEIWVASEPFAPGHIILEPSLVAGLSLQLLFLWWMAVNDFNATQASIRLIPTIVCGVSGSLFAGLYMQRTGRYYWLTVICYSTLVLGMLVIILCAGGVTSNLTGIIIGMCICGFSNGIGVTSTLIALIANAGHEDQAIATACSYLFRSLGSVFGVSISATVVNQSLRNFLREALKDGKDADTIAEKVRESLDYLKTLEPSVQSLVRDCYAKSTRFGFGAELVLVLGAAISAWWIKETRLSR